MISDAFDLTPRTLAFAPELMKQLPGLVARFGATAHDAGIGETFPVIFARWDDTARTRLRAAALCNEQPVTLSDGRLAIVGALFTRALLQAVADGDVAAEELNSAQFDALRVVLAET